MVPLACDDTLQQAVGGAMTELFSWLVKFIQEFRLLVVVLPWERAIRVRCGNRVTTLEPGVHTKIPFFDEIHVINTRLRIATTGAQTLTTADGHTLTIAVALGFKIDDPIRAMLRMHAPETSCAALASSVVADLVSTAERALLRVHDVEECVRTLLAKEGGYTFEFVRVTDFAYARTFRLLQDTFYRGSFSIDDRKL